MIMLRRKQTAPAPGHSEDIRELQRMLACADYQASDADIEWAWSRHSKSRYAGWLDVDAYDIGECVNAILEYLEACE